MKPHSKPDATGPSLRDKIIGLGERSIRKSYYPQLKRQLEQVEKDRRYLEEKSAAMMNMLEDLEQTRASLTESGTRYRALVENINDVIFILDSKGIFSYISPVIQNFGGLTPEQVVGTPFMDFVHPDDRSAVVAAFTHVLSGLREPQEFRVFDKKGQLYYVRTSSRQLLKDGRAVGLTGVMSDITERKLAEIALLHLNRELQALSSCNEVLLHAVDEQSLLQDICTLVCEQAGYRMVWVGYAENDEAKTIRPVAWAGFEDGFLAQAEITWADVERGGDPAGTAVRTGKTCCFQDVSAEPQAAPWYDSALQQGFRASVALPLKDERAHTFGSLTIYSGEVNAFTPEEIRLLEQLAGDLAFGITVLRARKEHDRVESIMRARFRLLEYSGAHSADELLTATLDEVEALTGSSIGFYHVVEADQTTLTLQSWSTNTQKNMCTAEGTGRHYAVDQAGVWADCIRERRTVIHNDYISLPDRRGLPAGHSPVIREIVVPIFRNERIAAVIGVGNKLSNYDESDIAIVSQLGDLVWDINERKQSEQALRKNEEKFRTVVENTPGIVFSFDRNGVFTLNEGKGLEKLGLAPGAVVGKSIFEVYAHNPSIIDKFNRAVAGESISDVEKEAGKFFESSWIPVKGEDGSVSKIIGVSNDITGRKLAEDTLRELNTDFVALLENTSDFIYFKDRENRFLFCSQTLANITGHRSWRDMIGKDDFEVFPEETARIYREEEQPIFDEGKALLNKIVPYFDAQGERRWVNTNKWPVFDDNREVVGVFGISRDVTELKVAEEKLSELNRVLEQRVSERTAQLEEVNKELEAFSYSVSHDLRAPLRAIEGFSRMLLEDYAGVLDENGKRLLNVVCDNTGRMGKLIEDILNFSRTGRAEISFSSIDMEKMARGVAAELMLPDPGGKLQMEIDPIPPARGDSAMMRQVFVNLISNAIKFSCRKEMPMIHIGATVTENETIYHVKDNGAGFDMKNADRLFGVFQRLHSVSDFDGTGIGLAIVKRIVNRHGGRVWAEGKVGEGAAFYFSLPVNGEGHE